MAKRHTEVKIYDTPPTGKIIDADPPIRVTARVLWSIDDRWMILDGSCWAMAWTQSQVLIYWRQRSTDHATTVWLAADQVRRVP